MTQVLKISVITVCYNSEKTIEKCIQSVISQSYLNVEYIIVDGGSSDRTIQSIQDYRGNIDAVISELDDGIYDAMNKGINASSGDIICFLNSDDRYAHCDVLAQIMDVFVHGECDAVCSDIIFTSSIDNDIPVRKYPASRFRPSLLKFGWMPPHPGFFAKKELYQKFGGFNTKYQIAGDFEFFVRVFKAGCIKMCYLPKTTVFMTVGGISTLGIKSKILLNKEVIIACREHGIYTNWLMVLFKYPIKIFDTIFSRL